MAVDKTKADKEDKKPKKVAKKKPVKKLVENNVLWAELEKVRKLVEARNWLALTEWASK